MRREFYYETSAALDDAQGSLHQTLRVTPAMEAGVSNHVWNIEEIVGLLGD